MASFLFASSSAMRQLDLLLWSKCGTIQAPKRTQAFHGVWFGNAWYRNGHAITLSRLLVAAAGWIVLGVALHTGMLHVHIHAVCRWDEHGQRRIPTGPDMMIRGSWRFLESSWVENLP